MPYPSTIGAINQLPYDEKRRIYARVIPLKLIERYQLNPYLVDKQGRDLLHLEATPGSASLELSLYHEYGFQDPLIYGHITDTINGQLHVLLYILNDPFAARYNIDQLPDGTPTKFGIRYRNIEAEIEALNAGLNPGQVRRGPHMLSNAIQTFEEFVESLGHTIYFVEPLYYHNAVIFERYGFTYQQGRKMMTRIDEGFSTDGELQFLLDGTTPFRTREAGKSIRLRSWAIHDGILGDPYTNITMYKRVKKHHNVSTTNCQW